MGTGLNHLNDSIEQDSLQVSADSPFLKDLGPQPVVENALTRLRAYSPTQQNTQKLLLNTDNFFDMKQRISALEQENSSLNA